METSINANKYKENPGYREETVARAREQMQTVEKEWNGVKERGQERDGKTKRGEQRRSGALKQQMFTIPALHELR